MNCAKENHKAFDCLNVAREFLDKEHGIYNRIIIAGCRDFDDSYGFENCLNGLFKDSISPKNTEIVSGGATGTDYLAVKYAEKLGFSQKIFRAKWVDFGKSAGPIRNREMAKYGTALIAFWDFKSKGTQNMIYEFKKIHGEKKIRVFDVRNWQKKI